MDRAQRVDEKNWGNLSSFVTFSPRVIVIKMAKATHFF